MDLSTSTILITGSTSGIGLALAEKFLEGGAEVIVVGRRKELLDKIKAEHPKVHVHQSDVTTAESRVNLFKWATTTFPKLNVLINNAGVQRFLQLDGQEEWSTTAAEIEINLSAPIHLCQLFIPFLRQQSVSYIVNTTSGLAFVAKADVPVYCATKAALHSFTMSLRYQLSDSPIKVLELIPPAVQTELGGHGTHTFGVPLEEYINAVYPRLVAGDVEVPYGFSAKTSQGSRAELDAIFNNVNAPKSESLKFFAKQAEEAGKK